MAARRIVENFWTNLADDIHKCSLRKQTGVSLKYMMNFGSFPTPRNLLFSAQFLHKELRVRLAHRVVELENLPYGLSSKTSILKVLEYIQSTAFARNWPRLPLECAFLSRTCGRETLSTRMEGNEVARRYTVKFKNYSVLDVQWMEEEELADSPQVLQLYLEAFNLQPTVRVRDWYVESFKDLQNFPEIQDNHDEVKFSELIHKIKVRHNDVIPTMAMGIRELKHNLRGKVGLNDLLEIHQFLDRFFMSRIGIRMLIGQHVAMHNTKQTPGYLGLICTQGSPMDAAKNAIDDARSICLRTYGSAPEVQVFGDPKFTFAYVPTHLHHMVFELVKNSLRAVQERFMTADQDCPPIRVIIADGAEDVTIKVSDEGGGIPRSGVSKLWTYLYSTANSPSNSSREMHGVMAGYGFGLPISRLYARYFGGDLQIISMEGYGTDAYLHLNRLGNVQESLP